jgi:hypothetical protein
MLEVVTRDIFDDHLRYIYCFISLYIYYQVGVMASRVSDKLD